MYCSGEHPNENKRRNSRDRIGRRRQNTPPRSNRLRGGNNGDESSTFNDLLSIFDSDSDSSKNSDSESQSSDGESVVVNSRNKRKGLIRLREQSVRAAKYTPSTSTSTSVSTPVSESSASSTGSESSTSTPVSESSASSTESESSTSTPVSESSASSVLSDSPPSSPVSDSLSDESTEGENVEIVVLTCSECDNITEVRKYLKQENVKKYNLITVAGCSLGYNTNKLWQKCINSQIGFFDPRCILIIDHEPCSIYNRIYDKNLSKDKSKRLKKTILCKLHKFNEEKALAALRKKFPGCKCKQLRLTSKD
jgi:hypothetical protein